MKKILLAMLFMLSLNIISFAYEDDYEKIYIVKISKQDIYKAVNATKKQQKKLDSIFKNTQKKASKVDDRLKTFEDKKSDIAEIEAKRYEEIRKVLTETQMEQFNQYVNNQKILFEEKNNKVMELLDNLNLTNGQKNSILKYERDFQREIGKLNFRILMPEKFSNEYENLKNIRNEKIEQILDESQKEELRKFKLKK